MRTRLTTSRGRSRKSRLTLTSLLIALLTGACQPGQAPPVGRPTERPATESPSTPEKELPPIVVDSPKPGAEVSSPVVLAGTANVFEATVSYRIVGTDGDKIANGFTTATCGSGCRGDYQVTVPFKVTEPTVAQIQIFESSAEDGSPLHMVRVKVTLLP